MHLVRGAGPQPGKAVHVDPMLSKLEPPGTKHMKLKCDTLLSNSAFKFKLRRCNQVTCRLRLSPGALIDLPALNIKLRPTKKPAVCSVCGLPGHNSRAHITGGTLHCSVCAEEGHNKLTCPRTARGRAV